MSDSLQGGTPGARESGATRNPARDFALALLVHEQDALREINDALDRIDRGTYGICAVTGLSLPAARLRAVPWTRHLRAAAPLRDEARHPCV